MATRTLGLSFKIKNWDEVKNSVKVLKRNLVDVQKKNKKLFETSLKYEQKLVKEKQKSAAQQEKADSQIANSIKLRTSQSNKRNKQSQSRFRLSLNRSGLNIESDGDKRESDVSRSSNIIEYKNQAQIIATAVGEAVDKGNDTFIDNYKAAFEKLKSGNIFGAIFKLISRPLNQIVEGYYGAIGGEFGARVGQKYLGLLDSGVSSFKNRRRGETGEKETLIDKSEIKQFADIFFSRFRTTEIKIKVDTKKEQKEKDSSFLGKYLNSIFQKIAQIQSGYFEGIGNYFGEQFAIGLGDVLKEELNYSSERRGRVMGRTIAGVSKDGIPEVREKLSDLGDSIKDLSDFDLTKLQKVLKSVVAIPSSIAHNYLKAFRRGSVREEGMARVSRNEASFNEDVSLIRDIEQVIITASGFAGEGGTGARGQAKILSELNEDDKTLVISSDTPYTDVGVKPENIASGSAWGVNALANTAGINLKGFNPDSIELVNKVLALKKQNPEIAIKIVGHSAGGFVAEEAQYLLELLGIDSKTLTMGTPNLRGNLGAKNIERVMGGQDPLSVLDRAGEAVDFANDDSIGDGDVEGHDFTEYIKSGTVREKIFERDKNKKGKPRNIPRSEEPTELREIEIDEDKPRNILQEYHQYLDNLVKSAQSNAEAKLTTLKDNYKQLTIEQRKDYGKELKKEVTEKAKQYRQAIERGDLETARAIGESLLVQIQTIKKLYRDIKAEAPTDRGVSGHLAHLSSIETEVRTGQPNKKRTRLGGFPAQREMSVGSADTGLETELSRAVETSSINGNEVVNGFVSGISNDLDKVKKAGASIGDTLTEETRKNLGIQSPSKVFRRIGKQIIRGLNLGLTDEELESLIALEQQLEDIELEAKLYLDYAPQELGSLAEVKDKLSTELDGLLDKLESSPTDLAKEQISAEIDRVKNELAGVQKELKEQYQELIDSVDIEAVTQNVTERVSELGEIATRPLQAAKQKFSGFVGSIVSKFPALGRFKTILKSVAALFLGGMGISFVVSQLGKLGAVSLETAMKMEVLDRAIVFVSRNAVEGAKNLDFISQKARELGINSVTAKANYASLLGAAKGTSLEGFQTEQIFTAFAESAANRGLDDASTDRLFTAVSQIIAKRRLGAEEVRQQIGDIAGFGDFEGLVASSLGVNSAQLDKMMGSAQVGIDVLPKVAATLQAQNNLADSTATAQTLQNKYNNSITDFQNALGQLLQPFQKLSLSLKTLGIETVTGLIQNLGRLLLNISGVVLVALIGRVSLLPLILAKVALSLKKVAAALKFLWASKAAIAQFLSAWLLVAGAIATVNNLVKLSKNNYKSANSEIAKMTAGVEALSKALAEASGNGEELNKNLPQTVDDLQLNKGILPDNRLGRFVSRVTGADRINLDPVRKLLRGNGERGRRNIFGQQILTQAEKNQYDFLAASGETRFAAGRVLNDKYNVRNSFGGIETLDEQLRELQSKRLSIPKADTEALNKSLEKEREILKERDKLLKVTTQYQSNLDLSINAIKKRIEELDALAANGEILSDKEQAERTALSGVLEELETEATDFKKEVSKIPNQLSEFSRRLRNASERIAGFMEERDRISTQERTQIITEGVTTGEGEQTIQLKLDRASQKDLQARIDKLQSEASKIETDLGSAALTAASKRVEEAAQNSGGLTTEVINRLLDEERDPSEKEALKGALELREIQTQLYQYQEQFAQSAQQSRSQLIDFNRTISDYFFNLTQQIKEARLEAKTLVSQIFANDIRNKLKAAIKPGSDSFVNGLIDGIQGILDQAQSILERTLGIEGNRIQFASESRSLDLEMQDFIRNVGGASDALLRFRQSLDLAGSDSGNSGGRPIGNSSNSNTVTALRRAIIGKESAGRYNIVNKHSGALGYGQVMPFNVASWTKAALGKSLTSQQFLQSPDAQIKTIDYKIKEYLDRELSKGFDFDIAIRRVASTWYSGQPQLYNDTRPQTYGAGKYPSINDYTADILKRFNNEAGKTRVSDERVNRNNNSIVNKAVQLNQQLKSDRASTISLNEKVIQQESELLDIQQEQQLASQQRQFDREAREATRSQIGIRDRANELFNQSQLPTAELELENNLRQVESQFRDFTSELAEQKLRYQDTSDNLEKFIKAAPSAISQLRARGDEASARFLEESVKQFESALPAYKELVESLTQAESRLPEAREKAIAFTRRQGKLLIENQAINRRSRSIQIKTNIATQRGTNELRRQNELAAERIRLEQRINEIRRTEPNPEVAENLIQLERQQSAINRDNIDRDAVDRERAYEQKLLELNSGIANSRGGFLQRIGLNFQANRIQRDAAIEQEKFRYRQELEQLERAYGSEPEKLELLKQRAEEFNRVRLEEIKQQFKSVGGEIQSLLEQNFTNFVQEAMGSFFNGGDRERQLLEQELKYKDEMLALEEKYRNNPGGLDFARERVKKLNEEKLDKIKQEFNAFNNIVNAARTAVVNLLKEIARMAAQKMAASIISSVLGGALGNIGGAATASGGGATTTSLNFSGGTGAFTAKEGITVPQVKSQKSKVKSGLVENFKNGGRIVKKKISDRLQQISKPIKKAFQREGKQGVLGVFTPGEEILSIKTGEAGRYQALKKELGISPLEKIFAGNFMYGGTAAIEDNLLGQLNFKSPSINLRAINNTSSQSQTINNVTNFSAEIITPDADSFRQSQYQSQQDIAESLLRNR